MTEVTTRVTGGTAVARLILRQMTRAFMKNRT